MGRKFGEALFFIFIFWLIWVLVLGTNPTQRMQRACTIVTGPGHFLSSMASALNNDWGTSIYSGTTDLNYRCQLTLWTFYYGNEWKRQHPNSPLPGQSAPARANASVQPPVQITPQPGR